VVLLLYRAARRCVRRAASVDVLPPLRSWQVSMRRPEARQRDRKYIPTRANNARNPEAPGASVPWPIRQHPDAASDTAGAPAPARDLLKTQFPPNPTEWTVWKFSHLSTFLPGGHMKLPIKKEPDISSAQLSSAQLSSAQLSSAQLSSA
jgi:hypothetical protein